jgi:hypothetical protein
MFSSCAAAVASTRSGTARATTSFIAYATNSGNPSVRSCNARTNASSVANDGHRCAT